MTYGFEKIVFWKVLFFWDLQHLILFMLPFLCICCKKTYCIIFSKNYSAVFLAVFLLNKGFLALLLQNSFF